MYKKYECDLEVGGSDQWGNIVSGVDFIRRKEGKTVYGLTWPLLADKAGRKFGKSEQGTVWLDAGETSPFQFYQFWLNSEDDEVEGYLLKMTTLAVEEVAKIMADTKRIQASEARKRNLHLRQQHWCTEVTQQKTVEDSSLALFGKKDLTELNASERELLQRESPTLVVRLGMALIEILIQSGLASSKREARQFIDDGAVTLNGGRVSSADRVMMHEDFQDAPLAILTRGKRNVVVLTLG